MTILNVLQHGYISPDLVQQCLCDRCDGLSAWPTKETSESVLQHVTAMLTHHEAYGRHMAIAQLRFH